MEISSFYTCVPKITIVRCTVLEISSERDTFLVILHYFLPYYAPNKLKNQNFEKMKKALKKKCTWKNCNHFTNVYQKLQSCDACFLRYEVWHFWVIQQPRKLKLCKNKNKKPRDITFLQMCKWRSYDVCFLRQKVQLRKILAIFGHFTPWQPGKLKFWNNEKNAFLEILFYTCAPKMMII